MSLRAANPTGLPHLSLRLVEQANNSLQTCNGGGERVDLVEESSATRRSVDRGGLLAPGCR